MGDERGSLTSAQGIFDAIVKKRKIQNLDDFINPKYEELHSPSKLPDIDKAVQRIVMAHKNKEKVAIYGDYDIDGLTATTILLEAFNRFGIEASYYLPDRFSEGYGLSREGIETINKEGAKLIVTVDCGSRSLDEIDYASELGLDVVVTDHHEVGDKLPGAVAVVNPKRPDSKYPWNDLAGVGVAFKLITALQKQLDGFPDGQEKWLLDMVALGTVCDVVDLQDENRTIVWWGLKVMARTKWPSLRALAQVSGTKIEEVGAEDLGYRFGPRLNAAGRMEHARQSLLLLTCKTGGESLAMAEELNALNQQRQADQRIIYQEAKEQADRFQNDPVLVLASKDWSHGINGIVASNICGRYKKPTFILQEMGDKTKGSARSYGDFHLADALKSVHKLTINGGGHRLAAGVTIETKNLEKFRKAMNDHYKALGLEDQERFLKPNVDVELNSFEGVSLELINLLEALAPFGTSNNQPIFSSANVKLDSWRPVGADQSHAKFTITDKKGYKLDGIGFKIAEQMPEAGSKINIMFSPQKNDFNGRTSVQANLLKIGVA